MTPVVKAPEGARCGTHPDRAAVDTCTRCGAFVCGECGELFNDTLYCSACYALVRPHEESKRAVWTIRLGFLSLVLPVLLVLLGAAVEQPLLLLPGPPLGAITGLGVAVAARMELLAIRRKEAPFGGRRIARWGLATGLLAAVIWSGLTLLAFLVASTFKE